MQVWAIAAEEVERVAHRVLAAGNSLVADRQRTAEGASTLDPSNLVVAEAESPAEVAGEIPEVEVELEVEEPVGKAAVVGTKGMLGILVVDTRGVVGSMSC